MCNLYDLGPRRHRNRDDWEEAVARALALSRDQALNHDEASETRQDAPETTSGFRQFGIRKTDPGLVLLPGEQGPDDQVMRWGFRRPWNSAINNARLEKLDGPWADAWQARRRCLVPMSAFYEWSGSTGARQTFAFTPAGEDETLWAAGMWEKDPEDSSFRYTMITTAATPEVAAVHTRMPALLRSEHIEEFLGNSDPRALLERPVVRLDMFRCRNPLTHIDSHDGPERETFLPGFE